MNQGVIALGIVSVVIAGVVAGRELQGAAQSSEAKPAWRWSVDERVAARFDPALRQKRAAAHGRPSAAADPLGGTQTDVIHGADTPALFLEWELFDKLVETGFPEYNGARGASRQELMAKAAALGFGADLWTRLERVAAPYLRTRRQDMQQGRLEAQAQTDPAASMRNPIELCRKRSEALAAAKVEFGEEQLLRLLYEVIAPQLNRAYVVHEGLAEELKLIEEGCP